MSFLSDVMGAGASFAMGNPLGAANDLVSGISSLFGGGNSQQQVQQQLAQLDQALQLPPGTLENVIKSNQSSSPFGMEGGPSGAMQQAMNTMQEGMNEMDSSLQGLGPGFGSQGGTSQAQSMQQALNAVHEGQGEVRAGMETLQALKGQHGEAANTGRKAALSEIRQGMAEEKQGMNTLQQQHHHHHEHRGLSQEAMEGLRSTIANRLEQMQNTGQNPFVNSLMSRGSSGI